MVAAPYSTQHHAMQQQFARLIISLSSASLLLQLMRYTACSIASAADQSRHRLINGQPMVGHSAMFVVRLRTNSAVYVVLICFQERKSTVCVYIYIYTHRRVMAGAILSMSATFLLTSNIDMIHRTFIYVYGYSTRHHLSLPPRQLAIASST